MKTLGAILAGGGSRRFGSDKAAAWLEGRALIDHVADGLRAQVDALIVCGREWPGIEAVADRPAPGLGPLGGLCAALHHAQANGFDRVMSAGCDVLPVMRWEAPHLASGRATYVAGHYLFGIWPSTLAPQLDAWLATSEDRSLRGWIAACGAQSLSHPTKFFNLNTPAALLDYAATKEERHDLPTAG